LPLLEDLVYVPRQATRSSSLPRRLFLAIALILIIVGSVLAADGRHISTTASFSGNGGNNVALTISSKSFANGGVIPKKYTCDAGDVSPDLSWNEPPTGAKSFALLADDPDAPVGNWNHWTLWNAPAELRGLPEGTSKAAQLSDGTQQGMNDFRKIGYNGPCPPPGKPHRYYFKLYALDAKLTLKENSGKRELEAAMKGHVLAQAEWMGRYGRK
jgi:Raf kinase inhibitor-like YbhB/YbcL family protein